MSKIMKIIDERETHTKKEDKQGVWELSKRVRDKWFCWAFNLGFLQLICKASLIFSSNLELALSIILKERQLYESKHIAAECRCLRIWDLLSFLMLLNPSFKMATRFTNIARTTASTSKFIYLERFQIIRNWVSIWKIIFNFEWSKS